MKYHFQFETITQEPFEANALKCIADFDPVGLLKKCRKRQGDLKKGTRRLNWQLWTACYAGALGIRRMPDLFTKLLEDDYFKHRIYKADLDDLLRLALLIGTDADAFGTTYKNACAIAGRLQPLFDAEVEPMEVLKRIEAAGGLKRLDVSDVMKKPSNVDDEDDDGDEEEEVVFDDDQDDKPAASPVTACPTTRSGTSGRRTTTRSTQAREGQKPANRAKAQPKQATKTSDHVSREVGDGMVILEVEVTPEVLGKVLEAAHSLLHVKRVGPQEGWQRIVGVSAANSS